MPRSGFDGPTRHNGGRLDADGAHSIIVSDSGIARTGNYDLSLFCLSFPGSCPDTVHPVVCDIQLDQSTYFDGDTVIARSSASPIRASMAARISS